MYGEVPDRAVGPAGHLRQAPGRAGVARACNRAHRPRRSVAIAEKEHFRLAAALGHPAAVRPGQRFADLERLPRFAIIDAHVEVVVGRSEKAAWLTRLPNG